MSRKSESTPPGRNRPTSDNDDRRIAQRYGMAQPADMRLGQFSGSIEVLDLSETGVKCRVSTGFAPFKADRLDLTFADGTTRSGIVRWTSGQNFGLAFDHEIGDPKGLSHIEAWSGDNYASLIRFQKRLQSRD